MAYLIIVLMCALGCWWDYRMLYPKPRKYLDCAAGCGAQLLKGIHFNADVEGHELPNGDLVCRKCHLDILDEVDEAIGIPAAEREMPVIQATPDTRKKLAAMTKKWPCAGDDLSNLDAEFEANLAAERVEKETYRRAFAPTAEEKAKSVNRRLFDEKLRLEKAAAVASPAQTKREFAQNMFICTGQWPHWADRIDIAEWTMHLQMDTRYVAPLGRCTQVPPGRCAPCGSTAVVMRSPTSASCSDCLSRGLAQMERGTPDMGPWKKALSGTL